MHNMGTTPQSQHWARPSVSGPQRHHDRHASTIYGLTLRELYENVNHLLRVLLKDARNKPGRVERLLQRIKRKSSLGYLVDYPWVFVVVQYINIDFIECEITGPNIAWS